MSVTGEFKNCPFCREQIRAEAVKCRFCGQWLDEGQKIAMGASLQPVGPMRQSEPALKPTDGSRLGTMEQAQLRTAPIVLSEKIGGWLLLFLFNVGFAIPFNAIRAANAIRTALSPLFRLLPIAPRLGIEVFCAVHWAIAAAGVYCAYALWFKKYRAVQSTKRGIVVIVVATWFAGLALVPVALAMNNQQSQELYAAVSSECVFMTGWALIWYLYFVRSERVRRTYLPTVGPGAVF